MIDFKKKLEEYKKEALDTLIEILKYETVLEEYKKDDVYPFGKNNAECLEYILKKAELDGFIIKNVDNYAGHIAYGSGEEILGILGHLDVVPAVGKWDSNPFDPVIKDGKIYARGTLDDKGPVVATYYALKLIKDLGLNVNKEIRLIVGCDEESGSRCLKRYFQTETKPTLGFSPDADFPVIYGEKGIMTLDLNCDLKLDNILSIKCGKRYNIVCDEAIIEFENLDEKKIEAYATKKNINVKIEKNTVTFYGISAHAMTPDKGVNAIYLLMEYLEEEHSNELSSFIVNTFDPFGVKLGIDYNSDDMGALTINLGILNYENSKVSIGYNLRLPNDKLVDEVLTAFSGNNFELSYEFKKTHYVDPNKTLVKTLMKVYQEHTNDYETKPFTIGGGTYAREINNAVAFGARFLNREDVVHQINEYIYLEDFYDWIILYAKAIYELVK